jgi:3',5'-cyclic AMP phosphodiesterase CpdA
LPFAVRSVFSWQLQQFSQNNGRQNLKGGIVMESQKIIHLSDLHIGLSQKESIRTHMIFESIANKYEGIPVLITGDIVDSATVDQFIEARKLAVKLSKTNPILMVPGNHDYKWKGNLA